MRLGAPLPTTPLPYNTVFVDLTRPNNTISSESIAERLAPSIDRWKAEGKYSCMLKLPIEEAGIAATAAKHGFVFHHVPLDGQGRHIVLKRWMRDDVEDKVPPLATHQVGVAGMCIDDRNRVLLVKEWRNTPTGREPSAQWKLPGGLLDAGESFAEAACRETLEETGVRTEFNSLLSFWHRHGLTWGQSDLYYVARLSPTSADEVIQVDPEEISMCKWMDVDTFLQTEDHPLITAVLRRAYGRERQADDTLADAEGTSPLLPLVEMIEAGVQWPGRDPYPTYFAQTGEGAPEP